MFVAALQLVDQFGAGLFAIVLVVSCHRGGNLIDREQFSRMARVLAGDEIDCFEHLLCPLG